VTDQLAAKLKTLPAEPGVYFHKSASGEIIYVGKAAVLKNRVRQYFHKSRAHDAKTDALVAEIADTDWVTVDTEIDALFLESELIKRYMPRYNILERDDKALIYIRINMNDAYPHIAFTRGPMDDGADYFGPYYNGQAIKRALRYLRKSFPYSTHDVLPKRVCLQYHLGLCPGVEEQKISSHDYKETLHKLIRYIKGDRSAIIRELTHDMDAAAKTKAFEEAAKLRNRIRNLKALQNEIIFRDHEFMDLSKDQALSGLAELLGLKDVPRRIEGYDISHMSGTNNVASMVVSTNGIAHKAEYRKFKLTIPGNNDFAHMHEALSRRFSGRHSDWTTPNLLLIDGGKGQLDAALRALEEKGLHIPAVGLAKREEEIVIHKTRSHVTFTPEALQVEEPTTGTPRQIMVTESDDFFVVLLPKSSHIVKLLQRVRNESHRFAVSYHTTLKRQGQVKSILDEIPGVGPATRKKLIQVFGSARGVKIATRPQLTAAIGKSKADLVWQWCHTDANLGDND
jgi:excinuclease ABC subunit C